MARPQDDIKFLKAYRDKLADEYSESARPDYIDTIFEYGEPASFFTSWDKDAERAAKLADKWGEPGTGDVFREYLFREDSWVPGNDDHRENLKKQALVVGRIIGKIEDAEESRASEDARPPSHFVSCADIGRAIRVRSDSLARTLQSKNYNVIKWKNRYHCDPNDAAAVFPKWKKKMREEP